MLENLQTLLVGYWFKLKSGFFYVLTCPTPITRPLDFVKKAVIYVHYIQLHGNDICVVSFGHYNHHWCLTIQCTSSPKCKAQGCKEEFAIDWQKSFGFFNKAQENINSPLQFERALFTKVYGKDSLPLGPFELASLHF